MKIPPIFWCRNVVKLLNNLCQNVVAPSVLSPVQWSRRTNEIVVTEKVELQDTHLPGDYGGHLMPDMDDMVLVHPDRHN